MQLEKNCTAIGQSARGEAECTLACCKCNFKIITLKPMWLLYDILLIINSTVRGEAVLFLAACYFLQTAIWGGNCTLLLSEFYTVYEIAV